MDNPQERPAEPLSADFLGGLVTGEGWFGLCVQRKPTLKTKHGFTISPRFSIQMNDAETMYRVIATLRAWEIGHHVEDIHRKNGNWTGGVRVSLAGFGRTEKIITRLLPHLTGEKKRSAEIVLRFIELRRSKPQASPYGDDEASLVNQLRAANGARKGHKTLLESSETIRRASRVPA